MRSSKPKMDSAAVDRVIADARRAGDERLRGYRDQALKMYPWVCGRCARSFTRENLRELTVHHRDHNHDHNPADGSNWELLCLYCHDNEHARFVDVRGSGAARPGDAPPSTGQPFSDLKDLLARKR